MMFIGKRLSQWAWGTLAGLGALAVGIGAFVITTNAVGAKNPDWPPLTMTYVTPAASPDGTSPGALTFRLDYTDQSNWKEQIIAAPDVRVGDETFSKVGYYQQLSGDKYSIYDPITRSTRTQTVRDGVVMIPRSMLSPLPISTLEGVAQQEATKVTTATRVCFRDDCESNATGWRYEDKGNVLVYADDARGIPIRINDLVVSQLTVQDSREAIARSDDNGR